VTNVLTIRNIVVVQQEGMKGRPGHRVRSRKATLEGLEGRSLLSALAPVRSTYLVLPDGYPAAAEVESSAAARPEDRSDSGETAASVPDDPGRTARSGDGDVVASPPGERVYSGAAGSSRRLNSQEIGSRELLDPLLLVSRSIDAASTSLAGDAPTSGLELIASLGGGDPNDSAGAASLVGWAPGTPTPATMSLANPYGRVLGPDGRTVPGLGAGVWAAGGEPLDSVGLLVSDAAIFGPTHGDVRTATDLHSDVESPLAVAADPDRGSHVQAWADILDSALHPDWEAVDGELRQFLSRLGDLNGTVVGQGAGHAWLLWIGAATTIILARRASHGRWLSFRGPAPWRVGISGGPPVPVGPWPLGPP
jgi:hypothetical protein